MKKIITILIMTILLASCAKEDKRNSMRDRALNNMTTKIGDTDEPSLSGEKILVYSLTGDWKVNYGDQGYGDEYSTYEIFYTESTHKYELVMEGFQPKNHSSYEEISKLIININNAVLDGYSHKQIRLKYLQ